MQETERLRVPSKSYSVLTSKQGASKIDVAITFVVISLIVGVFAYLSFPYVQDARNVMAIANCRNVKVTAEICLNNPDPELTYSEQLEEEFGNDMEITEDQDYPGQYTGDNSAGEIEVTIEDSELTYVSWSSSDYEGVSASWTPEDGYESN